MSDVVQIFPPAEESENLILQCPCGGTTFRVHVTGDLECASCGDRLRDDVTGIDYDSVVSNPEPPPPRTVIDDMDKHRFLASLRTEDLVFIAVAMDSGTVRTWVSGTFEGAQLEWVQKRLDDIRSTLGLDK